MRKIGCILILLVVVSSSTEAFGQYGRYRRGDRFRPHIEVGVRGLYDYDLKVWGAGGQLVVPVFRGILFYPNGSVLFADNQNYTQYNLDVRLNQFQLYFGGGLAFVEGARLNEEGTQQGSDLFVGLQPRLFRMPFLTPFVEARWTYIQIFQIFTLHFGVNFRL